MVVNNGATPCLRISNLATHIWPSAEPVTAAPGNNVIKDDTMKENTDKYFLTSTIQEALLRQIR